MSMTLSITERQTLIALRSLLLRVLPTGVEVIRSQVNRVSEPIGPDFVEMTQGLRTRLATNVDTYEDCVFVGSIADAVLSVSEMGIGVLAVGAPVYGPAVADGTVVTALGTGKGGVGTYRVSPSQTVAEQTMAAGVKVIEHSTQVTIQLDVHGPNSADNAAMIATLFRDDYARQAFASVGYDVSPLYAGEPHQVPFLNGEQQYEERWIVDLIVQVKPSLSVPQQFADRFDVTVSQVT